MGGAIGPLVLMGSLFFMLIIGMPIAFALGIAAFATAFYVGLPLEAILLKLSDGVDNFSLLAIPFFVLAGALMAEGGMAWRLVAFANIFVGFMRGGLAMVNILASMFFGGISGSAVADTSSIGSIMIPMMKKHSHNAIIYTYAAGGTISIAQLFLAGVVPGIMVGLALMVLAFIVSKKRGYPKGHTVKLGEALRITWEALAGLLTVGIIVGGVIGGVFTPTESAAVASVWAFFVTMFIYRDLKWRELPQLLQGVVRTVAMVMIVIGFASSFAYLMVLMQVPAKATALLLGLSDNKIVILLLINVMLLVLGTFMDMAPLLLICTPILLPVVVALGVDPVHFGIVMMLNLGTVERASRHLWPFWLAMVVVLLLVTFNPELALWIPGLLYPR
jgi:TRAP-type C4-dicarboxylate transport system permease large subunit